MSELAFAVKSVQPPDFRTMVEAEIPRLRRYARALTRSDVSAADDLVQDTLTRGLLKQHLWVEGTNLRQCSSPSCTTSTSILCAARCVRGRW
jgi:DNA-directed RNA polymerase specialized sigma24 family protein